MNLKKVSGKSITNPNQITDYVRNNHEILRKQIELYNPDIIICGGTKNWIKSIYPEVEEFQVTLNGVKYAKVGNKLFICFYHPAYRRSKKMLYVKFVNALNEIIKKN